MVFATGLESMQELTQKFQFKQENGNGIQQPQETELNWNVRKLN